MGAAQIQQFEEEELAREAMLARIGTLGAWRGDLGVIQRSEDERAAARRREDTPPGRSTTHPRCPGASKQAFYKVAPTPSAGQQSRNSELLRRVFGAGPSRAEGTKTVTERG